MTPHEMRARNEYREAISEHAFLLRCEGLKLHEIGARMGVSTERVRQRILYFSGRMNRACLNMRDSMRRERMDFLTDYKWCMFCKRNHSGASKCLGHYP